ncbi:phd finger and set domain-containing protein [Phlyctema vagabunda]|uniref:Phd finger and set domain-containing protein n=1 Tax=Phlyctema vagabunda TaxID=108571 RepID=A0ABR4PYD6_9HELO
MMTERLLLSTPQSAHPLPTPIAPSTVLVATEALPVTESVDEEPYTIKCICDYAGDDGNTIYCETCDTWQHIECFYPGRVADASREEFDHSCADCKPRPLDRRLATERQQIQLQQNNGDKKTKRPPSKSHKKKTKPSDLQVNGLHDHDHKHNSPHEHHPPPKSKGHRSTKSINSVAKRSPSYHSRPQSNAHPPSPAHTPPDLPSNFEVHGYSDNFQSLYKDDPTTPTEANTYSSLTVSNTMSSWLHDPVKLRNDTGVENRDEVFYKVKVGLDELKWPDLRVERKDSQLNGTLLHWRYLTTPKQLTQSGRIGELNGLVGFQREYVNDPENRWQETPHPRPFVFFHPRLPIFIDTRRLGSKCRYVRRSCRPNTSLEIYTIADSAEYHFWLISEGGLAANEQITLNWDFRFPAHVHSRFVRLLKLGDEDEPRTEGEGTELTEEEYNIISDVIHQVLSDHGGCACDLGSDCAFARFHQNYHGRLQTQPNGKPKKGRKPKNHASPNGTGHATNSRAASEGQQEQNDEDDNRSVSGSVKSKPRSRDLTPLQGVRETSGLPAETSDREKRKLAIEEQLFQKQAEQGQPPRKKKRASDGPTAGMSASTNATASNVKPRHKSTQRMSVSSNPGTNGNPPRGRQYVDASTSRRQSGSPYSVISPTTTPAPPLHTPSRRGSVLQSRQTSTAPTNKYVDSSTQTDAVENAWFNRHNESPRVQKHIIPLSRRLLNNRKRLREQQEARAKEQMINGTNGVSDSGSVGSSAASAMELDLIHTHDHESIGSPTEVRGRAASIVSSTPSVDCNSVDIPMADAPATHSIQTIKPPPPPWSVAVCTTDVGSTASQMKLQMPSIPTFSPAGTLPESITPLVTPQGTAISPIGSQVQSTFVQPHTNGITQPSPVKTTKKLSLSDYKARRKMTDTTTTIKPSGNSPTSGTSPSKPSLPTVEEIKVNGVLEGSAIVDTPMVEKTLDPMATAGEPAVASTPSLQEGLNGTL